MSAIEDNEDGHNKPIKVLFTLHPNFQLLDFTGPLDVLGESKHDMKDLKTKAFECRFVSATQHTVSSSGCSVRAHMDYDDAHGYLDEFDVLVVPGGGTQPIIKAAEAFPNLPTYTETVKEEKAVEDDSDEEDEEEDDDENSKLPEPLPLILAFAKLQRKDPTRERTLFSVCTGSLFLARLGLLQGMGATTHPNYYTQLEILCQQAARRGDLEQTDVMEERYVVNNARFTVEDGEENPFLFKKKPDQSEKSKGRKGSTSWKQSTRRESVVQRATMRWGGLRVITAGGVTCGIDAALYLVAALVSHDGAKEIARIMQFEWKQGVTVGGIDV